MLIPLDNGLVVALVVVGVSLLSIVGWVVLALVLQKYPPPLASQEKKAPQQGGFWGALIFGVLWSAGVLAIDTALGIPGWQQFKSRDYATVEGEVVRCEAHETPGEEGTNHHVDIEYAYKVANQQYTSTQVRYWTLWSRKRVHQFVEDHPPKSRITVYFDPDDPGRAVLVPGLGGQELFFALFLLPFNTVMIAFWVAGIIRFCFGARALRNACYGVRVWNRKDHVRIRLPQMIPEAAALMVLFTAPIVFVFLTVCCIGTTFHVLATVWVIVMGIAMAAYFIPAYRLATGRADLVIDCYRQSLTLPRTFGRKEAVRMARTDLVAIDVDKVLHKTSEGSDYWYAPTVRWRGADGVVQEAKLAEWDNQDFAEELAAWIRNKVGLSAQKDANPKRQRGF